MIIWMIPEGPGSHLVPLAPRQPNQSINQSPDDLDRHAAACAVSQRRDGKRSVPAFARTGLASSPQSEFAHPALAAADAGNALTMPRAVVLACRLRTVRPRIASVALAASVRAEAVARAGFGAKERGAVLAAPPRVAHARTGVVLSAPPMHLASAEARRTFPTPQR
eukprot:CAMPEP_0174702020 /NCGR_PEP_ID=MMETSP1094-20130205/6453_1 /TAXON_ID=156173 /ORGANISM="Chrysochromulina brevifilum, Strain UTEX LB 985" /LENGTH=165 /DNA_ID=CAMNT_0015899743 /DNA_START=96 /DNA_END=593 /DNA_ORIENTATION=-